MKRVISGSDAVAHAVKMCKVDVFPMYPITPSTLIPERISEFIFNGELKAEMIHVESEHSAASAMVGAAAAGARVFSATSSQGLALMFEILPILSGMRLPVVMAVANRALSAPINIWNDHSDAVSVRDQGWIQLFVESSQEAFDTTLMAFKIAENEKVQMPAMVCLDGYTLTHMYEPVEIEAEKKVHEFLPKHNPKHILDIKNPKTFGPIGFPNVFMEFKHQQQEAMHNSLDVIKAVNEEFGKTFGRKYGDGLIELYQMKDAEYAVLCQGTICGTARVVIDQLRKKGVKAGMIKLKALRPFPKHELREAAKKLKGLGVVDRHVSLGYQGAVASDVKSALAGSGTEVASYIAGLGGRDVTMDHFREVFADLKAEKKSGGWLM